MLNSIQSTRNSQQTFQGIAIKNASFKHIPTTAGLAEALEPLKNKGYQVYLTTSYDGLHDMLYVKPMSPEAENALHEASLFAKLTSSRKYCESLSMTENSPEFKVTKMFPLFSDVKIDDTVDTDEVLNNLGKNLDRIC